MLKKESLEHLPLIYDQYQHRRDTREQQHEFDSWMEARKENFIITRKLSFTSWDCSIQSVSLSIPQGMLTSGLKNLGVNPNWNDSYGYHDTSFSFPDNKRRGLGPCSDDLMANVGSRQFWLEGSHWKGISSTCSR